MVNRKKYVQGVRMKDIINKLIISQKAFVIHMYGLLHYKMFSEYVTFSANFTVGSLGGTTNIQTIFDLVPRSLRHVWCCRSHSIPHVGFQVLNVFDRNL
jgi:hypothetical protein